MRDGFYASEVFNPDSHGLDFGRYIWRGVKVENGATKLIKLTGSEALEAYISARDNQIFEMAVTTGAIAMPSGYSVLNAKGSGLEDQKKKFKKKRRKRALKEYGGIRSNL